MPKTRFSLTRFSLQIWQKTVIINNYASYLYKFLQRTASLYIISSEIPARISIFSSLNSPSHRRELPFSPNTYSFSYPMTSAFHLKMNKNRSFKMLFHSIWKPVLRDLILSNYPTNIKFSRHKRTISIAYEAY